MDIVRVQRPVPSLRAPTLIVALSGWNDAAEVATQAVRFLVRQWDAEKYADIDPETLFVFSESRPRVRIVDGSQRRLDWPRNDIYVRRDPVGERDFIIMVGSEPHLRWRTFVAAVLDQAEAMGATLVVTLGALLADVPHSRAVRLTGSATDPHLAERLGRLNVRSSRYEGPTGVIGVLNQSCRARRIAAASLWGNVPHYINHSPNPRVTVALLRRLSALLDLDLELLELEEEATQFDVQIAEAISRDPEARAYVQKLEERDEATSEDELESATGPESNELPTGEEVVRRLEEFLRRRPEKDEEG